MSIEVLSLTHTAPNAESLRINFIRGITKKRQFTSKHDILSHYNKVCRSKDIIRASTEIRYTLEEHKVVFKLNGKHHTVIIPPFFTYDGESIGVMQKFNYRGSRLAAMFHDYTYYSQKYSKKICDELMKQIQIKQGVPVYIATLVNIGLKLFGKSSYKEYSNE